MVRRRRRAPEEFKDASYKAYLMCFGSTGMFEQDDVENWVSLTSTAARLDGPPAAAEQPDGPARRRHRRSSPALDRASGSTARARARRLRRVQPARAARPWADYLERRRRTARAGEHRHRGGDGMTAVTSGNGGPTPPSRRSARTRPRLQRTGRTLPFDDERHLQAHQWLVDEAYLLDAQHYDDVARRCSPTTSTTSCRCGSRPPSGAGFDTAPGMAHFDEDKYSLSPPRRPLPHRARLDRGPAVAAAPPRHQRAHLRDRRPTTTWSSTPPCCCSAAAATSGSPRWSRPGREDLLRRVRRRLAARPPHDPGRRLGAPHAEPGDLPVSRMGPRRSSAAPGAARRARLRRSSIAQRVRRGPWCSRVDTRNGSRLLIESPEVRAVGRPVPAGARGADLAEPRRPSRPWSATRSARSSHRRGRTE